MKLRKFKIIALLAAVGCASIPEEELKKFAVGVRTIKGDAPMNCSEIGDFRANGGVYGFAYAKTLLRYSVGKAGGNLLTLDIASSDGISAVLMGTGYKCPKS